MGCASSMHVVAQGPLERVSCPPCIPVSLSALEPAIQLLSAGLKTPPADATGHSTSHDTSSRQKSSGAQLWGTASVQRLPWECAISAHMLAKLASVVPNECSTEQFVRHALLPVTEAAGKVRVVDLPVFARQLMPVSTHARSASSKSPHQSVPSSSPQYTPTSKSPNHLLQSQSQHAQQSSTMKLDATAMPHTKAAMGISRLGTATLQKKVRTHACNDGGSDDSNTCLKQWMAHKSSLGLSHTTTGPATVGALCKAHQGVNSGAGCHGYIFLSHRWAAPFRQTINLALLEIQATALSNLATPNNSNSSTAAGADWSSSNGTSAPAAHQHEQAGHGDGRTYSACSDAGESAVAARKVLRTTYVWMDIFAVNLHERHLPSPNISAHAIQPTAQAVQPASCLHASQFNGFARHGGLGNGSRKRAGDQVDMDELGGPEPPVGLHTVSTSCNDSSRMTLLSQGAGALVNAAIADIRQPNGDDHVGMGTLCTAHPAIGNALPQALTTSSHTVVDGVHVEQHMPGHQHLEGVLVGTHSSLDLNPSRPMTPAASQPTLQDSTMPTTCASSCMQHSHEVPPKDQGPSQLLPIAELSQVIRRSQRLLLACDSFALPLGRTWCLWELWTAGCALGWACVTLAMPGIVPVDSGGMESVGGGLVLDVRTAASNVIALRLAMQGPACRDVRRSEATLPCERSALLAALAASTPGGLEAVNQGLRVALNQVLRQVKQQVARYSAAHPQEQAGV